MKALRLFIALTFFAIPASSALAIRTNLRGDMGRMEEMGHYEEALFFRRSTMDMVLALHVRWAGAAYDPQGDSFIFQGRVDRRYWNIVNDQKRPITDLLAKAKLTPEQLDKLEDRIRVYVENHLSPEFDEMGNFYFRRNAWALERMGMFYEASFFRRLTGQYELRVCVPYYSAIAEEMAQNGKDALSAAYAAKAQWFRQQGQRELRRSNGNRSLGGSKTGKAQSRQQILETLKAGLRSEDGDVRLAVALALADQDEIAQIAELASDASIDVRGAVAAAFAENVYTSGLDRLSPDKDPAIQAVTAPVRAALSAAGKQYTPGVRARYFNDPAQQTPVAQKTLPSVAIGFCGNERFSQKLRAAWKVPEIMPPAASGQFLVRFDAKLYIPHDGTYRFYVKTEGANRATVRLISVAGNAITVITPRNDKQLLYAVQGTYNGPDLTRVDFSLPTDLKQGFVGLEIEYKGAQAKTAQGTAGLRLYWSSDQHVMEPVPAGALFHEE